MNLVLAIAHAVFSVLVPVAAYQYAKAALRAWAMTAPSIDEVRADIRVLEHDLEWKAFNDDNEWVLTEPVDPRLKLDDPVSWPIPTGPFPEGPFPEQYQKVLPRTVEVSPWAKVDGGELHVETRILDTGAGGDRFTVEIRCQDCGKSTKMINTHLPLGDVGTHTVGWRHTCPRGEVVLRSLTISRPLGEVEVEYFTADHDPDGCPHEHVYLYGGDRVVRCIRPGLN